MLYFTFGAIKLIVRSIYFISLGYTLTNYLSSPYPYQAQVGPTSVGYALRTEALVFGGSTLTATDIAVASGHAQIGTHASAVKDLAPEFTAKAMGCINAKLEDLVNAVKVGPMSQ